MKIEEYIRAHFEKRLQEAPVFVVYDPERRYAEISKGMDSDKRTVIDGTSSTIRGREAAMDAWKNVSEGEAEGKTLLIYLPMELPRNNLERQRDPYWIFVIGGGFFPESDGESYKSLCHKAFPEYVEQIDDLFAHGIPDFETINNLAAGGTQWPVLRTILKVESAVEILTAFLSPSNEQRSALDKDDSWVPEIRKFCSMILGYNLKTKGHKWSSVADDLWRFVLFSEFAFDLPGELPQSLADVPHAPAGRESLIFSVCDNLRGTERHQMPYMQRAYGVEDALKIAEYFDQTADFGKRDTFAFQERTFLTAFLDDLLGKRYEEAGNLLAERKNAVWVKHDTVRQTLWIVAERALQLISAVRDVAEKEKTALKSVEDIVRFYTDFMRQVDGRHREFEQAVADAFGDLESLEPLVKHARGKYRDLADRLQKRFVDLVAQEGWPCAALASNSQVFDRFVGPAVKERRRTAVLMIDALRYELAVELERELAGKYSVSVHTVCAQLPTVTAVGMASLLPEADGKLFIKDKDGKPVPVLGEREIRTPHDRLAHVRSILGDRCEMVDLSDLASGKKISLSDTVDLLLVKTTDIDAVCEANPADAYHVIPKVLSRIISAVNKLKVLGFEYVVTATDHGFVLLDEMEAGHVIEKPSGNWTVLKNRCLLGRGGGCSGCRVFNAEDVGIKCDYEQYVVPESFGTFAKAAPYFHEGLSLQECVLPVLAIDMRSAEEERPSKMEVQVSYKGGATDKITTLRPMIELAVFQADIFGEPLEINLEAWAGKKVVGEVGTSEHVNPATGLVRIKPGQAIKVQLKMDEEFRGSFEVRAYDPVTGVRYGAIKLKTDYLE
jgi:hypothetical protein